MIWSDRPSRRARPSRTARRRGGGPPPTLEEPRRFRRGRVGREVRVGCVAPHHEVADGPADQVELVPGGLEAVAKLLRERFDLERGHGRPTLPSHFTATLRGTLRTCPSARVRLDLSEHAARSAARAVHVPGSPRAARPGGVRSTPAWRHVADAPARSNGDDGRVRDPVGRSSRGTPPRARASSSVSTWCGGRCSSRSFALAAAFGYRRHPMEVAAVLASDVPIASSR